MGFPRQECWSGLPFPSPGDFPKQESNPWFLPLSIAGGFFTTEPRGSPINKRDIFYNRRDKNAMSLVIENSLIISMGDSLTLNESKNPEEYMVCLMCFICLYIHDSVYFCIF